MSLTEWPHGQGIRVTTEYRWYREGTLPVPLAEAARRGIGPRAVLTAGGVPRGGAG